jgi:hypothetical protein
MKKLLLLASLLAGTGSLLAQGTVAFSNSGLADQYKISTNNATGTAPGFMSGANGYRIGLYAGPAGTPAGSLTLAGLATNAAPVPAAGYFNGGNPFVTAGFGAAGTTIAFQVRAWAFSAGTDWAQALTRIDLAQGVSALGSTTLGGGTTPPGGLWTTTNPNGITGFTIAPVIPEPSSIALGLLGLGAIALFRRRK